MEEAGKAPSQVPVSKRQQKRMLKQQRHAETKDAWKLLRREKRKATKLKRSSQKGASADCSQKGASPDCGQKSASADCSQKSASGYSARAPIINAAKSGTVLIDCGYESLMHEKQITRCYAINRRSSAPFFLSLFHVSSRFKERMIRLNPDFEKWDVAVVDEPPTDKAAVYLSADSSEVLSSISRTDTYIIGGIVDRNRHKDASSKRAQELNIATAKLPIRENIELQSSTVLTVISVFEVLTLYDGVRSWGEILSCAIPQRKQGLEANK